MLVGIWMLVLCHGGAQEPAATLQAGERPYSQMNRDIRAFMLREMRAESDQQRVAAIEDLCAIYEELKRDGRLVRSTVLQGYKAKVYGRLLRIQRDLERQMDRLERQSEDSAASVAQGGIPLPDEQQLQNQDEQWAGAGDGLAGQFPLLYASSGGATSLFWNAGGSYGGGVVDYGDDLIRLIQRTIEPEFWDVNGGPGSIYFYRPLNALVVRATSEVHRDLGGALDGLRKAGGR